MYAKEFKYIYYIISAIVCEELEAPRNGRVEVSGSAPGDQATYSCNAGFDLIGQTVRICQNDGTFSGRAPTCQRMNICLYVCMYARPYVCIYVCMYACIYVCMYACTYIHAYVIIIIRTYAYKCIFM